VEKLQGEIWSLCDGERRLKLIWTPGHCGLQGNERADEMTKQGSAKEQLQMVWIGVQERHISEETLTADWD
jgi:ribonuclease HI